MNIITIENLQEEFLQLLRFIDVEEMKSDLQFALYEYQNLLLQQCEEMPPIDNSYSNIRTIKHLLDFLNQLKIHQVPQS